MQGILRGIAVHPQPRAAMELQARVMIDAASGLAGDRFRKPGPAQVTLIAWEKWLAACADLRLLPGITLPWTLRRANLLIAGTPLEPERGRRLQVGAAVLEITSECDPCQRMEEQHAGLRAALMPDARGGVRARILTGGEAAVGDAVVWLD